MHEAPPSKKLRRQGTDTSVRRSVPETNKVPYLLIAACFLGWVVIARRYGGGNSQSWSGDSAWTSTNGA